MGAGNDDDTGEVRAAVARAALLDEAVRRRVFRVVRLARRPVTRDEVAGTVGVSRGLAAFHLDRLVEAGLLRAGTQDSAVARAGRRPKTYEMVPDGVQLSLPERRHQLLADVLVETLLDPQAGEGAVRVAVDAAERRGRALGRSAAGSPAADPLLETLERVGFEPYLAETEAAEVVRLGNCPFHPLAARSPELVCRLNLGLVEGLVAGLGAGDAEVVLSPRAGDCCVEVRRAAGPGSTGTRGGPAGTRPTRRAPSPGC